MNRSVGKSRENYWRSSYSWEIAQTCGLLGFFLAHSTCKCTLPPFNCPPPAYNCAPPTNNLASQVHGYRKITKIHYIFYMHHNNSLKFQLLISNQSLNKSRKKHFLVSEVEIRHFIFFPPKIKALGDSRNIFLLLSM